MFIVYTKDNKQLIENSSYQNRYFTWDDIPQDTGIVALALTHLLPTTVNNKKISPKINIKKYHYYYFYNEATVSVLQSNTGELKHGRTTLTAKIIAGVDVEREYVLEIRLDKMGNISMDSYPLQALKKKFDSGQMSKSILKSGIACTKEKSLL